MTQVVHYTNHPDIITKFMEHDQTFRENCALDGFSVCISALNASWALALSENSPSQPLRSTHPKAFLVKVAVVAVVGVVGEAAEVAEVVMVAVGVTTVVEETETHHRVIPRESPAETSHGGIAPAPLASLSTRLPLELGA
jgi:hypothetical protein